jgi:uncharacterized delta-60 repeat protein
MKANFSFNTPRLRAATLALLVATGSACEDDDPPAGRDAAVDGPGVGDAAGAETGDVRADAAGGDAGSDGGSDSAPTAPPIAYAAVRFNVDGTLDTGFGTGGVARIPLGAGANALGDSALYGIAKDTQDRLVLFGVKRHETRTDTERAVARLTAEGQLDTNFGTMGFHVFGIETAGLADQGRNGIVQSDGKIVFAGYANQPTGVGTQSTNAVVLLRLLDTGMRDTTFGVNGVVNFNPFRSPDGVTPAGMAEAYGIAQQSTGNYVTVGYARDVGKVGTPAELVVNRWSATNGAIDNTFGPSANGSLLLQLTPSVAGSVQGRNVAVLPGDRLLVVGNATTAPMQGDALLGILQPNGAPDTSFDTDGVKTYDFMRPDEALYGVAVAPNGMQAVAVGYRSGTVGGVMEDDDSVLVLLPLGAGTESSRAVELSTTGHDRFWAAAFDASNRAYAAGFVQEGGDRLMAVARFNPDGTLDTGFGMGGVAKHNVATAGTIENARAIVIQATGKIVIAGAVEMP